MAIVSDLDTAMMQPARSVPAVRQLGGGTIRVDDSGRPLHASGRDAIVYELRTPTGRILALRCLLKPDKERERALRTRYTALREDPTLEPLRVAGGPLPHDIRWVDEGVLLPGLDLARSVTPIMAMERVPGRTMMQVVDRLCREGQAEPLAFLADRWLAMALALEQAAFIHGDLAADNLIVRPDGSIAAIDLDTASWPSFPGSPARAGGTPGYSHPSGSPGNADLRDRFAALVIWTSLRILSRHPSLREGWSEQPERHGGALLWSANDLRRPERSPLFGAIGQLGDAALTPLIEVVRRAIRFSPELTPPLSEIVERLEGLGVPRQAAPRSQIGRRGITSSAGISPATTAPPTDGRFHMPPDSGEAPHHSETDRSERSADACRIPLPADRDRGKVAAQRLRAAIAARDTDLVRSLWNDTRAMPETAVFAVAVQNLVATDAMAAIDRAMRRKEDAGLVAAVADAELAGVSPPVEARAAVRAARTRIATRTALNEAILARDYNAIAALKLAGKLDDLDRLDPIHARTVARAVAWPALEHALAMDDDVAIAFAADPAIWREEDTLPPKAWQRLDLARRRLRWADDVRQALRRRDGSVLRGLLAGAPPGAERCLTEIESRRILRATMREAAVTRLERALREGPDREVLAAMAEFESAGAPFSGVLDWAAVRGVVDRASLAEALQAAALADPPDTARLARLLPAARAALGDGGTDGPDWAILEQSVLRAAHLTRLREAIDQGDDRRIASAAEPDPYDTISLLSPEERDRVQRATSEAPRQEHCSD